MSVERGGVMPAAAATGAAQRAVTRWRDGTGETRIDLLAEEVPIAIVCNGEAYAVMLASPLDLADFARGFALTERLVTTDSDIRDICITPQLDGIEVALALQQDHAVIRPQGARAFAGRSGCGLCGVRELDGLLDLPAALGDALTLSAAALQSALAQLPGRQSLNRATGATHAAAWCDAAGSIVLLREDVGRHNALDKLIGAMLGEGIDPGRGFVLLTSRASVEMVIKAARAGIAVVAAVSAPTALAVSSADSVGITLIGFARGRDCSVYTHGHRYKST